MYYWRNSSFTRMQYRDQQHSNGVIDNINDWMYLETFYSRHTAKTVTFKYMKRQLWKSSKNDQKWKYCRLWKTLYCITQNRDIQISIIADFVKLMCLRRQLPNLKLIAPQFKCNASSRSRLPQFPWLNLDKSLNSASLH
jgi:hypothetical protein